MKQDIKIPKGYKNSPLGAIPEEWEVKKLGEIGTFFKGKGVPKNQIINNGYKCLTYGDLYTKYDFIIKNVKSFINKKTSFISQKINFGDICFAGSGETSKDIGKCAAFIDDKNGYAGGDIIILRANENPITLSYILNSEYIIKQKSKYGQGYSVVHIYPTQLKKIKVALPPISEQQKIAEILTIWDEAIERQNQLINLLEQRKHGLMQQLLTGKKRLKGFTEEWKTVKLGEIGNTYNGLTGKTKENFGNGNPFITYMNVFSSPKVNLSKVGYVNINDNEKQNLVKYGDIFFTVSSETPKEVGMSSVLIDHINNTYLNSFCFGFRLFDFKTLLPEYAQYFFRNKNFRKKMYVLAQGSTRFNISKKEVLKIKIKIPSILEQITISKILTEANNEINLAKQKLEHLQQQKKGLMQVLLTGKKRVKLNKN